jgi:hypothetical protein
MLDFRKESIMSQKWYQKASVQVALVTVAGAIIVALVTIAHQRSELKRDNKSLKQDLETTQGMLDDVKHERDKFQVQLAPFLATAEARFPDAPPDKRLELLLNRMEQAVSEVHDAVLRIGKDRVLSDYLIKKVIPQLKRQPKMTVSITSVMGDTDGFALAKQLETIFTQAGWPMSDGGVAQAVFTAPQKGCQFVFRRDQAPSAALQQPLLEILDAIGQEKRLYVDPNQAKDNLKIVVGSK